MSDQLSGQIDYIARQMQEQTQLLRELLELTKYLYEHPTVPPLYGLWTGEFWIRADNGAGDVLASPYKSLASIHAQDYISTEVREIGIDGLPVPIEEAV